MEQTRLVNLPVIGRVQHGEKINNRVTELHHFIAKIQDAHMQQYLDRFDKLYKGKQYIDIEIFDENPLSIKYARYNQSGEVCHCMENSNKGSSKTKDGWKQVNCDTFNCKYRQRNEQGKRACNRVAWFKFIIPSICKDRIFLMRITGQTSIDRLKEYFEFKKYQGKSIKGQYTLFLKDEEQEDYFGKSHTNKILDIFEKEESNIENKSPNQLENKDLSTEKTKKVDKIVQKQDLSTTANNEILKTQLETENKITKKEDIKAKTKTENKTETKSETETKKTTKSARKTKTKATDNVKDKESEDKNKTSNTLDVYSNYYIFDSSKKEMIKDKKGIEKEYLVGKFYDMKDKTHEIVIKPENSEEISNSQFGDWYEIETKVFLEREFAMDLKQADLNRKAA